MRRQVGNAPVQAQLHRHRFARVARQNVNAGRTIGLQAAAHNALVKALQPAQAAAFVGMHKLRVHRAAHRRAPANELAAIAAAPQAHAARRQNAEGKRAVVHLHQLDTFLQSAMQHALADARRSGHTQLGRAQLQRLHPNVAFGVRQYPL